MVLLNIHVEHAKTGHWLWKLVSAKNGKLVATSREYSTKQMCLKTATNLFEDIRVSRLNLVERNKSSAEELPLVRTLQEHWYDDEEMELDD